MMSIFYFGIFRLRRSILVVNKLWDSKREALREVLKELRVSAGLTQAQLAEELSKPQSYVSKYESGERRLDFIEVLEVSDALLCDYSVLVNTFVVKTQKRSG